MNFGSIFPVGTKLVIAASVEITNLRCRLLLVLICGYCCDVMSMNKLLVAVSCNNDISIFVLIQGRSTLFPLVRWSKVCSSLKCLNNNSHTV